MTDFFENKRPDFAKLKAHGFSETDGVWRYHVRILNDEFELRVAVTGAGKVQCELVDTAFGEPYTMHLVPEASGEFVGRVREAYERALREIASACFESDAFREPITRRLIEHAREKYGDEPEYLWKNFPDDAVLRRKDTEKWYAGIFACKRKSLGLAGEGKIEILDVRMDPEEIKLLVDGVRIFGGWHMNKKHWATILLDGTVPFEEVIGYLEESWHLAK